LLIIGDHKEGNLVGILTSKVSKLEKLKKDKLQFQVNLRTQQWNRTEKLVEEYKKIIQISDFVLWFPKGSNSHLGKFTKKCLGSFRIHYVLFKNTVLLIAFINFEPNPLLVNINKLKPYKFIEFKVQDSKMETLV